MRYYDDDDDTRGLKIVEAFLAGSQVEVTQETGVVPRRRRAAFGTC